MLFLLSCYPATTGAVLVGDEVKYLDDGIIRVGIDTKKGAAITWVSSRQHPKNIVNIADPGRLIQQSYYAGRSLDRSEQGQHSAWNPWPWNPIQGGGVGKGGPQGVWAKVRLMEASKNKLASETIPKLWDMENEDAAAIMKQEIQFEDNLPGVVAIECKLICQRQTDDQWGPGTMRAQELPACYFTRQFARTECYVGNGKWKEEQQAPGPPWGQVNPPLNAMAAFNTNGIGIGIYSPTANQAWNFGPHGVGNSSTPTDGPCIHIAPIARASLTPNSSLRYRYWLVVGNRQSIARRLDYLLKNYSEETLNVTN